MSMMVVHMSFMVSIMADMIVAPVAAQSSLTLVGGFHIVTWVMFTEINHITHTIEVMVMDCKIAVLILQVHAANTHAAVPCYSFLLVANKFIFIRTANYFILVILDLKLYCHNKEYENQSFLSVC